MAVELLAPARDLECGIAAIDCGADAVYIGAPRFGARAAAGNRIEDIAALGRYAHKYWARVYVTLNTLLTNDEIPAACRLAWQLHEAGVDGLIVQDTGLLECELPPLPLIASTQMHNHTPERVAFLEQVGFRRAILARELGIEEIRAIRQAAPRIELETFVHGALCVSYSGQCYLSYSLGGRSGNRGECAQPCRRAYTLMDGRGRTLAEERHLLSLKDLNLSEELPELLDAGVTSFKIEGRLKDRVYVSNVVAYYRARLDEALAAQGMARSSSGTITAGFTPNLAKTFNRGFTTYFLHGRGEPIGSPETPKMTGERVGRVVRMGDAAGRIAGVSAGSFTLDGAEELHAGDGLTFFDRQGRLRGTSVNALRGRLVFPQKVEGIAAGTLIHRNHDHAFLSRVAGARNERRIAVRLVLRGLTVTAVDEDGNRGEATLDAPFTAAEKPERAAETIRRQLEKMGDTGFVCAGVEIQTGPVPFVPVAALNAARRAVLARLSEVREQNRPRAEGRIVPNDAPFSEKELTYLGNVLNRKAEAFYRRHGVEKIEPAAESGLDLRGRKVMTTRYCILHQLGLCSREGSARDFAEPLALIDDQGRRLELRFDCAQCEMEVWLGG
jgi:23S rRNA 5-hydroxycytidine C2501 synthase